MRPVCANVQRNDVLLTLTYGCYWAFFVLFAYPSEFFPQLDVQSSSFYCTAVLFLMTLAASAAVARAGSRGAERVARSGALLVVPLVFLAGSVVSLTTLRLVSAESPVVLMLAFPVLLAWLGFCLTLRVCRYTAQADEEKLPVVLAASLLVSFAVGIVLTLTEDVMQGDSANYVMLLAAGVLTLVLARCEPENETSRESVGKSAPQGHLSAPAAFVVALTFGFYLLGSGAFMSLSSAALGTSWYSEGWAHCVIGLTLYVAFIVYALWGVRVGRDPYPWLPVLLLCMACLYCAVLFYADLAVGCREIVVASRPLTIVLLWAAVWEWRRAKGAPAWWVGVIVPPVIFGFDVVIQALGFFGLTGNTLLMVVNGIMLATAFAMAAALVFLLSRHGLRGSSSVSGNVGKAATGLMPTTAVPVDNAPAASPSSVADAGVSAVMACLAERYALSAREAEVLQLLYRGNTQKKIAESLFLSLSSVQTYSKSLYRKLGVHSRQQLIDLVNTEAS